MNPAIVVLAYNRPAPLQRLLDSIARGLYPPGSQVPLVLSIDSGGNPEVLRIARRFQWPHGEKNIVVAQAHLGLVEHFHRAGDLTSEFGSVVLLEDDVVVSPAFYQYASGALAFYADDDRIAGVSLYALWFNGYNHLPFVPLLDVSDIFFLQIPYTQGQAFTSGQWARYLAWRAANDPKPARGDPLHPLLFQFGPEEWFPERVKFLGTTARYFVYPRESLSTGFGDPGTHFAHGSRWFQVPVQAFKMQHRFIPLDESPAVYDTFFEILPDRLRRLAPSLPEAGFDVDLYASKPPGALRQDLVLSSRRSRAPLGSWGRVMWPQEANVAQEVPGDDIALSPRADLRWSRWEELRLQKALHDYFTRGRGLPRRFRLFSGMVDLWSKIGSPGR
ncbi:MAG: glycosyltransferase family 2 protein [Gemmatimonadetes bacterium]|nr:glycosyltransferase family 2 protein [Gemmatimonadota bacterium]